MKKIILAAAIAAFSFTAHAEDTTKSCIDVTTSLATMTESQILDALIEPGCGMSYDDAVKAIIDGGGIAANIPADPTAGFASTAAGGNTGGTNNAPSFTSGNTGSGGGGGVI